MSGQCKKLKSKKHTMEKLLRRKALMDLAAAEAGAAMAGVAKAEGAAVRWQEPPEPVRPAFEMLLNNINTECQSVMETTRELLLRRGV
jgi:hypothetical protein